MTQFLPNAYFEGAIVPFADAKLSVATHALHYGTAAYAGFRAVPDPKNPNQVLLFRFHDHTKRLSQGAKFLLLDISQEQIEKAVRALIQANKPTGPVYIRPLVYNARLGIVPTLDQAEGELLIYGLEMPGAHLSPDGVSCCFSSWIRPAESAIPLRGKIAGAYAAACLARSEATVRGFDEALMVNVEGKVCEGSAMNLFIIRNGQLITPSVDQHILEGITRDSVITLAREMGITVIERPVDKSEMIIADEAFLTGTAAKMAPINRVENYPLPSEHPIMDALKAKFTAITEGTSSEHPDWMTPLPYGA